MVKLIILFRTGASLTVSGEDYNNFLIKLEELPGLRRKSVSMVFGATGRSVPYSIIVEACFDSREAMEAALTSPAGVEAGQLLRRSVEPDAISLFADTFEETFADCPDARKSA